MEEIPSRSIEVGVISVQGLCLGTRPVKKNAFVALRTDDGHDERATSKMASASGGVISWNKEKLCLDLPYRSRFLIVEVHASGKLAGSARIPVSDFVGSYRQENHVQFLSYRLRDRYGVKNGVINVSLKVKNPSREIAAMPSVAWNPEIGFPIVNRIGSGPVVVGVPVLYASSCAYRDVCTS